MAVKIPYLVKRDGVFYYVRRVPKVVVDRPAALLRYFKGDRTVRVSLCTKDPVRAVEAAAEISKDFDRRVFEALDSGAVNMPRNVRPVTQEALVAIKEQRRANIERRFRQFTLLREQGGDAGEFAEDMIYQLEIDAEQAKSTLSGFGKTTNPRLDVDAMAADVVRFNGLDAPRGSEAYAAVKRVVREAELQGSLDGFDIVYGRKSILNAPSSAEQSMRLSAAVDDHLTRHTNKRTMRGIREARRCFVEAIGDLTLDQLRPDHFRKFCALEAAHDVGGKSKGSVHRPKSADTIDKKLTFLRSAITHAIDRGHFAGPNPVAGITAAPFVRPVNRAAMPDKRPFTTTELNRVFSYPWFTGCKSATRIHQPGAHRLTGMWYWGPIVALLTGCRAGELGGLSLDEVCWRMFAPTLLSVIISIERLKVVTGVKFPFWIS